MLRQGNVDKARAAWGANLPEWVLRLAEACDAHGVRGTAAKLKTSPALLSLAINHKHHSSYGFVEQRTRAMLMAEILECPALGLTDGIRAREELARDVLLGWPDERLALVGVKRQQRDAFFIDTAKEKLPEEA